MMQPKTPAAPFSLTHSPNVPELLQALNCSLAISTYQAGKIIFLSAKNNEQLVQLPRTFKKPMGFCLHEDKMVVATKDEVIFLKSAADLAKFYPEKPNVYDAMYIPRASYYTGFVDIHDIDLGANNEIFAVNTSFSCIAKIDQNYSFTPYWKPKFISKLASEDRCHLNGMALLNGVPKYATAFNQGDTPQSWRDTVTTSGVLIDVETDEIIAQGLKMPHSPRIFNNKLYVLYSATGELVNIDTKTGKIETVANMNAFVRGMAKYGDYLFIGVNKLRQNSSTFAKLDIAKQANWAGINILHLPTGALVGQIKYLSSVDEIYDIQVLPNTLRPNILNPYDDNFKKALDIPNSTFWAKKNKNN